MRGDLGANGKYLFKKNGHEKEKALRVPRAVNIGWRFTARMQVQIKTAYQQVGKSGHKNEDFSKSVSSFGLGPIFVPRLGQDLSRNAFVVSVYAL